MKQTHYFDQNGNLCVHNPDAYWVPELTLTEEIDGTIYTVTGSFEGDRPMLHKLERIAAKKFSEKLEEQP